MPFIKLQLGCLLIIAYIEITYIRATLRGRIPCNPFFDALLAVAPCPPSSSQALFWWCR